MTLSAFHIARSRPTGRRKIVRVLGAASLFLLPAILPVAAGAGDTPVRSAGMSAGAPAHLQELPEGSSVSSIGILDGDRETVRLHGLPGLSNVGLVAPGIFRGAQPRTEGFETLRRMGIRTVINLRPGRDERAKVEAAGMRLVHIPMKAEDVKSEAVRKVLSAMTDPANQPVFVHCKRGKHRAGVVMAVFRMEKEGWSRKEAKAEMRVFGYNEAFARLTELIDGYPAKGNGTH